MKTLRILANATLLMPFAGLLMGNSSCQEQAQVRELKKQVDLGRIISPALVLPGGTVFDFAFVANAQIAGVFTDVDGFSLRTAPAIVASPSGISMKLSATDSALYQKISMKGSDPMTYWSTEASCMVNLPMATISGTINSFELVGGGGIKVGFDPTGTHLLDLASLDFKVDFAQLDLSLRANRPLNNAIISQVNVDATQTKTSVAANINLGMFSVGPSFYYSTPLATVTKNGFIKALTQLKEKLKTEDWYTRVLVNSDTDLTIIGGTDLGVEVGDQMAVYNENYYWDGEPCNSTYRGGVAVAPVAVIQIEAVGDMLSYGRVIKQGDENAVIGAKVKLLKLHEATTAAAIDTSMLKDVNAVP